MTRHEPKIVPAMTYVKRPIRPLGLFESDNGIPFKGYGIHHAGERAPLIDEHVLADAKERINEVAAAEIPTTAHHGVGFYIVHQGQIGTWLMVDWWVSNILLHHRVFRSAGDRGDTFKPLEGTALICCTWEFAAMAYERDAWVRKLKSKEPNSLEIYLNDYADIDL